jgi:hypothetical protein
MLKNSDIRYAKKREKKFRFMGVKWLGIGDLNKFNSFNCGCAMCKGMTAHRRAENKSKRFKDKLDLMSELSVL